MRDDIREPGQWKSDRLSGKAGNTSWSLQRRQSPSSAILTDRLPVAAVDAAFEEVDLGPEPQSPHRIDSGLPVAAASEELVEKLTLQLAALEAQCHHLQGLLSSVKS